MILCSACLLGLRCRYDGKSKGNQKVLELAKSEALVPICPEQLGGLPTPRPQTELKDGRAVRKDGSDVTEIFQRGAEECLKLARLLNAKRAILKQRSPSCGSGQIYDGTFSGKIVEGDGLTTALLKANAVEVLSEEEL